MEKKEYKNFEKSIENIRTKVVEIKGVVGGVSRVKKNKKTPISNTTNVISISLAHEKE